MNHAPPKENPGSTTARAAGCSCSTPEFRTDGEYLGMRQVFVSPTCRIHGFVILIFRKRKKS